MIPKDFQVQTGGNTDGFEPLPADTYQVEIEDIELKKDQPVYMKPAEIEDRFSFKFKVVEEGDWKNRYLWKEMRPVMSAGSNGYDPSILYQIFCAVNGIKPGELTEDEVKLVGSDQINQMIGQQLRLVVNQKPNAKGEIKNKITGFLPLKAGAVTKPKAENTPEIQIDDSDIPF